MRSTRSAFTLLELLAVMFIIGLLLGLLFPAIMMAWVAVDKVGCKNNLKQIGDGMHNYASHNGERLPPLALGPDENAAFADAFPTSPWLGSYYFLLPFIGGDDLFRALEAQRLPGRTPWWLSEPAWNTAIKNIEILKCPARGTALTSMDRAGVYIHKNTLWTMIISPQGGASPVGRTDYPRVYPYPVTVFNPHPIVGHKLPGGWGVDTDPDPAGAINVTVTYPDSNCTIQVHVQSEGTVTQVPDGNAWWSSTNRQGVSLEQLAGSSGGLSAFPLAAEGLGAKGVPFAAIGPAVIVPSGQVSNQATATDISSDHPDVGYMVMANRQVVAVRIGAQLRPIFQSLALNGSISPDLMP